jgi:hypothetical protein
LEDALLWLFHLLPPECSRSPYQEGGTSLMRGHHGRDHILVGFITTCAISAYHH